MALSISQLDLLKENFVYHDKRWYAFNGNLWIEIDVYDFKLHAVKSHIKQYIYNHFKNGRQIKHYPFHSDFFERNFDKDPKHLICFTNGVYDFKIHQFRKGLPADCCTLCTNYKYEPTYDDNLWIYIRKVFPDNKDHSDFMKTIDLLFRGHKNIIRCFNKDNCGLTTLCRLIDMIFGSYGLRSSLYELVQERLYTLETELDYLKNHFKGRYINCQLELNKNYNNILCNSIKNFTSVIVNMEVKADKELNFKSTFLDNNIQNKYNYKIDFNLTKQFPSFALTLITKLIALQEEPIKILWFYHNPIFVQDVNQYILNFYKDIIYL